MRLVELCKDTCLVEHVLFENDFSEPLVMSALARTVPRLKNNGDNFVKALGAVQGQQGLADVVQILSRAVSEGLTEFQTDVADQNTENVRRNLDMRTLLEKVIDMIDDVPELRERQMEPTDLVRAMQGELTGSEFTRAVALLTFGKALKDLRNEDNQRFRNNLGPTAAEVTDIAQRSGLTDLQNL